MMISERERGSAGAGRGHIWYFSGSSSPYKLYNILTLHSHSVKFMFPCIV